MGINIDKCIEAKIWNTFVEIIDRINIWRKVYDFNLFIYYEISVKHIYINKYIHMLQGLGLG